jgi:hypothetical protein
MGLPQAIMENEELVTDLCRYQEGVLTEQQVRRKWPLATEEAWVALDDDAFVKRVELERVRRIRSGAAKRELAQLHIVKAPDVLNGILMDPRASAKHRIDSAKALDDLAGFIPQRPGIEQDRVVIRIDLSGDTKDPRDVLEFDCGVRRNPTPSDAKIVDVAARPMIEADNFNQEEVVPQKRGRGRPRGSKNKPKLVEPELKPRGVPGFEVND